MASARWPAVAAALAGVCLCAFLVYLAGGPLRSDDLWFHLAMGEHFASEGLSSGHDPLLHTAHVGDPVAHEWLFDVVVHGIDAALGIPGLRLANALLAAWVLALAYRSLRRSASGMEAAVAATLCFALLSWWKLFELRPHLVSMGLLLWLHASLLVPDEPPRWRRVVAATGVLALWVNLHSAFVLAPIFLVSALLGVGLRAAILHVWVGAPPERVAREGRRAARLGAATALGLLATLANPRGLAQHTTFLHMRESSILAAADDWAPFDPLRFVDHGGAISRLEWALQGGVMALFLVALGAGLVALWRTKSERALEAVDPVRAGLGAAGLLAALIAVRFGWLAIFALGFVLHWSRTRLGTAESSSARRWAAAAATVVLAAAFLVGSRFERFSVTAPRAWAAPFAAGKYHVPGVRFLAESGVEGNLMNPYHMGGFLGYWLAPRLQTFIDGRNEAYAPDAFLDWSRATLGYGRPPGETFLELLDRREVDLYFGTGVPDGGDPSANTTLRLWRAPGWRLVFRAVDHAIYLRANVRNRENLARIAAWYADAGVPFDPERGLDVERVLEESADWARQEQLAPARLDALRKAAAAGAKSERLAAIRSAGLYLALAGAFESQVALDREGVRLAPRAVGPRRRLVYGLLRLEHTPEAVGVARQLAALPGAGPEDARFVDAARRVARGAPPGPGALPQHVLDRLPLLSRREAARLLAGRYAPGGELRRVRDLLERDAG